MKRFRLVDNLMGWLIFAVAAWTYCSTVEPTASFWDCPEFITTGYKLEVGHPPGAPFFMLTANLFSQFVSDPADVAKMVNIMSALFSALCILFLYWTISHLVRRLVCKTPAGGSTIPQEITTAQLITTQVSATVGALAYCWSDTFWFSAVEGEVYAYSSLFTALVVWLMLKWEDHADEPHSDRWLILIAYMTGLSIGVHLLNLLCLPALVLIYYYRKFPNANVKGTLIALAISCALVAVVLYGIVPGIVKVGGWFELLFVNTLGCSFNTGLIIYLIVLVGVVLWAIWESNTGKSKTRGNVAYLLSVGLLGIPFYGHGGSSIFIGFLVLGALAVCLWWKDLVSARFKNTSLLCMLLIMIGYSSYAVIVIRSSANTPMDQNSPEDIFTLGEYLGREQYGDRPLLYGQVFNSPIAYDENGSPKMSEGAAIYQRKEKESADEPDKYIIIDHKKDYKYQVNMLFPRMYSDRHEASYKSLLGDDFTGRDVVVDDPYMGTKTIKVPTFLDNLKFFFSYQINYMYMRYFMWNFAGRQNDIQGNGELEHGNWLSGISVFDDMRLGPQDQLPDELKENKGHNVYYMLPLILGLIGLFWQILRSQESVKQFWVVFFLFFMTGLAIVLYLNQTPQQPRERDYAYAGSFYAFAIWIGLGATAITDWLNKIFKKQPVIAAAIPAICVLVPIQMAAQNWDDHDRSGRYTCRDFGQNYLMSLQEEGNPIIFTNGDNDTFPLWYNQETEGFRTDARVCNLSYLQTDWYIDQMKRPSYDSPALPISWPRLKYVTGTNEYVIVEPNVLDDVLEEYANDPEMLRSLGTNPYELGTIIDKWILDKDPKVKELKERLYNDAMSLASNYDSAAEEAAYSGNRENAGQYRQMAEMARWRAKYVRGPIFPTDDVQITVDKNAVKESGMMIADTLINDVMHISLSGKSAVYKSEMMMYEMLRGCNWKRPMYVAVTVGGDNYGSLGNNFVQEGLAYRITPFSTSDSGMRVDTKRMYDNLMNKFKYGGLSNPDFYVDETIMRMANTHRRMFSILIQALMQEGKTDMAKKALEKAEKELPATTVPHSYMSGSIDMAKAWIKLGNKKKAEDILLPLLHNVRQYVDWYLHLRYDFAMNVDECQYYLMQFNMALEALKETGSNKYAEYEKAFGSAYMSFQTRTTPMDAMDEASGMYY